MPGPCPEHANIRRAPGHRFDRAAQRLKVAGLPILLNTYSFQSARHCILQLSKCPALYFPGHCIYGIFQ